MDMKKGNLSLIFSEAVKQNKNVLLRLYIIDDEIMSNAGLFRLSKAADWLLVFFTPIYFAVLKT